MKLEIIALISLTSCGTLQAGDWWQNNQRQYEDVYRHSYKSPETLLKDSDGDGVVNRYDYNDRNPKIQNRWQAENEDRMNRLLIVR